MNTTYNGRDDILFLGLVHYIWELSITRLNIVKISGRVIFLIWHIFKIIMDSLLKMETTHAHIVAK
jgi:hypothetical protein